MIRKKKEFGKKKKVSPKSAPVFRLVLGERMSPLTVIKARPESLVAVDSAIVCEQIHVIRCSKAQRTSRLFKVVESAIYPVKNPVAQNECSIVRVVDSSTVVMRVSDVKAFFGKTIEVLPSISFRRCMKSGLMAKKGKA